MTNWTEDVIPADMAGTLDGLFLERLRRSPEKVAYRSYHKHSDSWQDCTWQALAEKVSCWQQALENEGLRPGDRVAILLHNRLEWVVFDQAALACGLVLVPLYTEDRPENTAYILQDSAARLLLLHDVGHWKRLAPALAQRDPLQRVLLLQAPDNTERQEVLQRDERLRFVCDWIAPVARSLPQRRGDPQQLATIVYTSGTTGRPKGVMLSHRNILSVAHGVLGVVNCYQQDLFLSFLPLSHTLERTVGYYLPMMSGATVAHARSVAQLAEDLLTVQPTVLIAVPRIFERVYGRIETGLSQQSGWRRFLFRRAVDLGWRRFEYQQGRATWHPGLWLWPLLKPLVADRIMARLGGCMRLAVSGGAALPLPVARTFIALGLPILQGYGLTETSPIVSGNTLLENDPASVGAPLRCLEVRIGMDDEIQVRSPGVMLGYWNNHAATGAMIDADGWLHTGDQGRWENGRLYITGRIKDILVLSNGEKVSPGDMESAIALNPLVDQVMVVGEGKSYLGALLVLNREAWFGFAKNLGLDPYDPQSLCQERAEQKVLLQLRQALRSFPGYAKVRRVALTLEPWTIENGLITPTLKVKRTEVAQAHTAMLAGLHGK